MDIHTLHLLDGARAARGLTVVIDVFRAFSVECHAFGRGAARIYPVADIERARAIGRENPGWLLVGERGGQKPDGFDFGNSPHEVANADLAGQTLIHTTSAGTQGIEAAVDADEIVLASLVNAAATARYIRARAPQTVSLVCMGYALERRCVGDTVCAEYIEALLRGAPFDKAAAVRRMRESEDGARFFDPDKAWFFPPEDFFLSTQFDRFDFALLVVRDAQGRNAVRKHT